MPRATEIVIEEDVEKAIADANGHPYINYASPVPYEIPVTRINPIADNKVSNVPKVEDETASKNGSSWIDKLSTKTDYKN